LTLQVDVEVQGDLLLAIVRGAASLDAALGAAKQVLDAAAKHQVSRILVDTLASSLPGFDSKRQHFLTR
jgi:hypothetical protein